MGTNSNVSLISAGIDRVRNGLETVEFGAVDIAQGVVASWATPFRWSYGQGDNEVSGLVSLSEMFMPVIREDGKADGKALTAIYAAVAENFGFEWGENKREVSRLKMMFRRGWLIGAAHLLGFGVEFEKERGKARVSVPVSVAFDLFETDSEGKEVYTAKGEVVAASAKVLIESTGKRANDETIRAFVDTMRVVCKGGSHALYGDVLSVSDLADKRLAHMVAAAGLMAPPRPRAARVDKAASFVQSLDFVTECMAMLAGSDESEFAPNEETEAKMRAVAESIAAYFAK